jgi:hypothetical protein
LIGNDQASRVNPLIVPTVIPQKPINHLATLQKYHAGSSLPVT